MNCRFIILGDAEIEKVMIFNEPFEQSICGMFVFKNCPSISFITYSGRNDVSYPTYEYTLNRFFDILRLIQDDVYYMGGMQIIIPRRCTGFTCEDAAGDPSAHVNIFTSGVRRGGSFVTPCVEVAKGTVETLRRMLDGVDPILMSRPDLYNELTPEYLKEYHPDRYQRFCEWCAHSFVRKGGNV